MCYRDENLIEYSAAKAWNKIPLNIRHSPTIYTFKNKLKDFYSIGNDSQSTIPRKNSIL